MLTIVVDALSWILIVAGGGFCIVGAIGMLRMPDCFTRMQAASLIDTLGAALLLLGLMLQAGLSLNMLKIGMVGLLLFFASPTATHALAKAAITRGVRPLLADHSLNGGEDASSKRS